MEKSNSKTFYVIIIAILSVGLAGVLFSKNQTDKVDAITKEYNDAMAFIEEKERETERMKVLMDSLSKEVVHYKMALVSATNGLNNQTEVMREAIDRTGQYLNSIPESTLDSIKQAYIDKIRNQ